jgi:chorismate-pyruvate lyase
MRERCARRQREREKRALRALADRAIGRVLKPATLKHRRETRRLLSGVFSSSGNRDRGSGVIRGPPVWSERTERHGDAAENEATR